MAPDEPRDFGSWLQRRRESAGLTQEELADRAGLTAKGIAALERGRRRRPYPRTIRALATALGVSDEERAALLARISSGGQETTSTIPAAGSGSSLPAPLTPLIGRCQDVADVLDAILEQGTRLVTLTGPGGVGKTSLAREVARQAAGRFIDGVVIVTLESLDDPAMVMSWIAASVGIPSLSRDSERRALYDYLGSRHLLLVLDNFEHLLPAATDVGDLIATVPELKVLVTSRAPLRIRGEREYPLNPLGVPALDHIPTPDELGASDAVRLLVDRAQATSPRFALTQANAAAIAAICRRLDGLPLALELAAARLRVLTPTELLARLDQSLPLLTGGARDLPERQRTMRQTIEWSYRLLAPEEQALFRRLSICSGGWDAATAETLSQGANTLTVLSALVEHSLVVVDASGEGATRYRMLETIRQLGHEQLEVTGEIGAARDAHLACFLSLAETAEPQLRGPEQGYWLQRLELEHGNLRAALSWALDAADAQGHEAGLHLAAALGGFWYVRGHVVEGEAWLQRALAAADQRPTETRARALFALGLLLIVFGDRDAAVAALETGRQVARDAGSIAAEALANFGLGDATRGRREIERAERHYRLALDQFRSLGNQTWAGIALNGLAVLAFRTGELDQAEALALEALTLFNAGGDIRHIAEATVIIGQVARMRHDTVKAASSLGEALASFRDLGDRIAVLQAIADLALVAVERGHLEPATRLGAAATATHTELLQQRGNQLGRWVEEHVTPSSRRMLGDAAFERAWREGQQLTLDAAITEALVLADALASTQPDTPGSAPARPAGLSEREIDVIRLVAAGQTNGQIADRLFLSRRTIDAHMRRIYDKLDLPTRTDVVRFAVEHGIA